MPQKKLIKSKDVQMKQKFLPKPKKPVSVSAKKPESIVKKPESNEQNMVFLAAVVLIVIVGLIMVFVSPSWNQGNNTFACPDGTIVSSLDECALAGNGNTNGNENGNGVPTTFEEKHSFCLSQSSVQKKDECLQETAIEFNKDLLCDELTNLNIEKCKRLVWKQFVVVSQEVDNCNKLLTEFDKVECIKEIALLSSDKSICSEIEDLSERGSCLIELAVQEKDFLICDSVEGVSQNYTCKFRVILAVSDASLCETLTIVSLKNDCISRIAAQENDVSLCERISDSMLKERCIRNLS